MGSFLKRAFDFFLSSFGLLLFSFPALVFVFLIKAEDGGPIFYFQERWGKGGKRFKAYKFRTMLPGADKTWGLKQAEENDVRVTRIGKFLRATAMDELPQLVNILKGDMSFVGPRALAVGEVEPSRPFFTERHRIRPGLTGPAQILVPRDAPLESKFEHDLDYVNRHSLGLDFKLLFTSLWVTLRGKWESRQKKV